MKTIGVISIKGGVGKTTAISNLAASLSNQFNKKVLVVDANFSAPNLGIHFGIINPELTIHDVLNGKKTAKAAIINSGHGFDIIPGRLNHKGKLKHLELKKQLEKVKKDYDFILIDSSPNLNTEMQATIAASDEIFVVSTPDFPTLSCTIQATKIAREKKTPIAGLILNRVYNKNFELNVEEIEAASECPVLAVIPHDVGVLEALSKTLPANSYKGDNEGAYEYNKLAAAICNEPFNDSRILPKIKKAFSGSVPKQEVNREVFRQR